MIHPRWITALGRQKYELLFIALLRRLASYCKDAWLTGLEGHILTPPCKCSAVPTFVPSRLEKLFSRGKPSQPIVYNVNEWKRCIPY